MCICVPVYLGVCFSVGLCHCEYLQEKQEGGRGRSALIEQVITQTKLHLDFCDFYVAATQAKSLELAFGICIQISTKSLGTCQATTDYFKDINIWLI